jgi:hypothetical protein
MNLQRDFDTLDPEGAWRNPSAIWDQMVVQAPNFVVGSVPAIASMAFGPAIAAVVGGVAGGAMSLGDAASQISEEIESLPEQKLKAQSSRYRELLDMMDPEAAREQLVTEARRWTSLAAAGIGLAGGAAFGYVGGKLMPGKSRLGRAAVAGLTESPGEYIEEGGTQVASNVGVKMYADPSRDPFEGAHNAGLMGLVTSAGPSTAMGALTPYVPTQRERQGFLEDSARLLQERIQAEQAAALSEMEQATTTEGVLSAAEKIVAAPLDTFELDQFHQNLTAQGLNRQAEIDSLDFSEGPFVSTRLWKETMQSGTSRAPVVSEAQQETFEAYDALSDEAKAYTQEPPGFQDWKAALAQVADQEVEASIKAEDDSARILEFLEKDVGAILDNEEVGPEVKNDQIRTALENARNAANPKPPPDDQGPGDGGTPAVPEAKKPSSVTVYGSGANGRADFAAQQAAGMRSGVEANRVTGPMVDEIAKSPTPVFVDSGAFGAFRKGETIDFGKVYDTYEAIDQKSETPNMRFVAPDVVGDQGATMTLQGQYADRTKRLMARGHEALIPVQKGRLRPRQVAEQVFQMFGNNVTLAIPANEAAFTEGDLRDLMRARPKKLHFLGVAANKAKLDKLTRIARAYVPDVEISADGNRIRAVTDSKFSAEAKVRKDDAAKEGITTGTGPAAQFDETEQISEFLDNPDRVDATALKAFIEELSPILPKGTTAARLMKAEKTQPGSFRKAIEEADEDGLYTRDAYFRAVMPAATRKAAGPVRKKMVAEKLTGIEKDDAVTLIAKAGGLDRGDLRGDISPDLFGTRIGIRPLFRKAGSGLSLDGAAEMLRQHGFETNGPNDIIDIVNDWSRGNKTWSPQATAPYAAEYEAQEQARQDQDEWEQALAKADRTSMDRVVFKRAGKPLDQIRVTVQATVAETGETVEINQRADLALGEIDNRIGALQQLLGCVG